MRQLIFTLLFINSFLFGQTVADFENFGIPQDSFLNGSDGVEGFDSGNIFLPNNFQDFGSFTAWDGWSISTMTDITTPGFTNDFSSIAGSGFDNSLTYATTFVQGWSTIELTNEAAGGEVEGFYINNSTYAFLSMQDGDSFAKKFGGATGDDPDFFLLTIKKYLDGNLSEDSINFYLADYRFTDNSQDYIIDEWTYVDLSSFGNLDSLYFTLSSSDNGAFGMNTPAYFCIDNVITADIISSNTNIDFTNTMKVYPNPVTNHLTIESTSEIESLEIYDTNGRKILGQKSNDNSIDVSHLSAGSYIIRCITDQGIEISPFIKS